MKPTRHNAFTIIELLVVVAILAVLAVVCSAAYQTVIGKASMAAEITAAKTLIAAYQASAADNNGRYLPARDQSVTKVLNGEKKPLSMAEPRYRYPFRLAPYFNYAIESTLLVGKNKQQILKTLNLSKPSGTMYDYAVSAFPAFGINNSFVGGQIINAKGDYAPDPAGDVIRTVAQADHSVIVFVSAGNTDIDGYQYVNPPSSWSGADWTDKSDPGHYGYVHARHGGKAVAAFLDGGVRGLTIDELRDMRLWSRNAAIQDNPDYRPR